MTIRGYLMTVLKKKHFGCQEKNITTHAIVQLNFLNDKKIF